MVVKFQQKNNTLKIIITILIDTSYVIIIQKWLKIRAKIQVEIEIEI